MHLTLNIPKEAQESFLKAFGPDLSEAAKEALIINGYRTGRISLGFVAELLGLATRFEAQQWLTERNVPINYDLDELQADFQTLRDHFDVQI